MLCYRSLKVKILFLLKPNQSLYCFWALTKIEVCTGLLFLNTRNLNWSCNLYCFCSYLLTIVAVSFSQNILYMITRIQKDIAGCMNECLNCVTQCCVCTEYTWPFFVPQISCNHPHKCKNHPLLFLFSWTLQISQDLSPDALLPGTSKIRCSPDQMERKSAATLP